MDEHEQRLQAFLDTYTPETAALAGTALVKLRERLPGALVLVYDNFNALAIGFGGTERASDAALSVAVHPRRVNLMFFHGAALPDPATPSAGQREAGPPPGRHRSRGPRSA